MNYNIKNEKIDELVRFEVGRFQDECTNIFKTMLDKNINESFNNMNNKLIIEIKNNIMKTIGGKNLYDYSEFGKYNYIYNSFMPAFGPQNIMCCQKFIESISVDSNGRINVNKFLNGMLDEEKIVIHGKYISDINQVCILHEYFITNYGRMLVFVNGAEYFTNYYEYNFWIPIDYIKILTLLCTGGDLFERILLEMAGIVANADLRIKMIETIRRESTDKKIIGLSQRTANSGIRFETIIETLKLIRDCLYDRKIIPLYVYDIVKENEEMKSQYDTFRIEKEKFDKEKSDFYSKFGDNLDLLKEKTELEEIRERLKIATHKLKIAQEKLEEDKKILKERMDKFNDIKLEDLVI